MTTATRALLALFVVVSGISAGCTAREAAELPSGTAIDLGVRDRHSYAEPEEARVTHVDLDLVADFTAQKLFGTAALTYEAEPGADEIVLDVRKLDVQRVTTADGDALQFDIGPVDEVLGRPLSVSLPEEGRLIVVHYETAPGADAVQWLDPSQTAGQEHPFLFTQGQAIHTRTWIPTQDSPGIRQTYSAAITVPEDLTAVMSAEMLTPEGEISPRGRTFRFRMDDPIPPYLIALAIGDLAFRDVGPRTGVWAEPSVVDAAAYEFADMPAMLEAAEDLYGPYRWGRFDVLVLPPSFPYGGMENPRLTFATPTLLAGDRSLVSVIAHELAHSWSGNLVTNATWDDFWLNEGFTTYFEYRIMEEVYGRDYADMLEQLGRQTLQEELDDVGHHSPDTRLKVNLAGRDPEGGITYTPYEKGAAFLRTIEEAAGRAAFDRFLRRYFDTFAFRPMTSERFLQFLEDELIQGNEALRVRIRPEEWVYEPGLPENAPVVHAAAFEAVERQAEAFLAGRSAPDLETTGWTTHEWLHLLNTLPEGLSTAQMVALDEAFGFTETGNSEILFSWLRRAIRSRYQPAFPAIDQFLTSQGRGKFVVPLFRELMSTDWGAEMARDIFARARPGYHPITVQNVERVMQEAG